MDRLTKEQRSRHMSGIGSKDTQPEWAVRRMLHGMGYRYRLHVRQLPGTPDLVFPSRRKVVFVHGCFWHGHDCGRGFRPKTNALFWSAKIAANKARDRRRQSELRRLGWGVLTVWECATKKVGAAALQARLVRFLES